MIHLKVDVSFIDDDAETVSDDEELNDSNKEQDETEVKTIEIQHNFNPTEAILATMQLLPLPCSAKSSASGSSGDRQADVRRNVSVVQNFALGGQSMMPRRKSKSQVNI